MSKYFIFFLVLLWNGSLCFAQKSFQMESITVGDGLSQGFVFCTFQDSRGFIWMGTYNGINRYDGVEIKRYAYDNLSPWSLKTNIIFWITEDTNGLLWLGTEKGVAIMDTYSERFLYLSEVNPAYPSDEAVAITQHKGGGIWVINRKDGKKNIFVATPPANLVEMIRQNKIEPNRFSLALVTLPAEMAAPNNWIRSSNEQEMLVIDEFYRPCKIDVRTLRGQMTRLPDLPYKRIGNYGLLPFSGQHTGFVFHLDNGSNKPYAGAPIAEYLEIAGEMPVLYRPNQFTLHQLDTLPRRPAGTADGLWNFYTQFRLFTDLHQRIYYNPMVDHSGNLWLGTPGYGVIKISPKKITVNNFFPAQSFFNFSLLPDGRFWPGNSNPFKAYRINSNTPEIAPWSSLIQRDQWVFATLFSKNGDWWVVTDKNNSLLILKKDHTNGAWQQIPVTMKYRAESPIPVYEDQHGNIWLNGSQGDIARITPSDNHVDYWKVDTYFPEQFRSALFGTCITEDAFGHIWLGFNNGVIRADFKGSSPVFQSWHNYTSKGILFKNDWILSLYPDPNHECCVWAGTRNGGLHYLNTLSDNVQIFTENDGLSDNVVYSILPDASGYLWLSTNRGICRFNPKNTTFTTFTHQENPTRNIEFNTGAALKMPSGALAFGSVSGLYILEPPYNETETQHHGFVEFTGIKINGKPVDANDESVHRSFNRQNEITLEVPFDKNYITFSFAALKSSDPASAKYRYRLLGLSDRWIDAGIQRSANFALIPAGYYTLEVQSINADGNWNDAVTRRAHLIILPPWYLGWPALLLYTVLLGLGVILLLRYLRTLRVRKQEEAQKKKELERLKSLDDFKTKFFSSISHEFKTPLTIILGQAKRISATQHPDQQQRSSATILQQGEYMLEMISQMIDITKLEKQELRLNLRKGNFSAYTQYLTESLRALTDFKNILLDFNTTVPDLEMDFDPLRLKYIISNLLSNAVRHTDTGGSIRIQITQPEPAYVVLEFADTGEGISPEDLPKVFDRYYSGAHQNTPQWEQRFGIGLNFVKDLVQLLGGKIAVSSKIGHGTTFTISFPVTQTAPPLETTYALPATQPSAIAEAHPAKSSKAALPCLLVVEDNPFITDFLKELLSGHYALTFAEDGKKGFEAAIEQVPDLILTDVMMPKMNGYELTQQLKSHELTSHIPVVMISALSGTVERIEGQKYGADAYLGKPFDEQELIMTLNNLHQLKYRWRKRYANFIAENGIIDQAASTADGLSDPAVHTDAFMQKIYAVFEQNYMDEEYALPQLCRDMEMSKSQLQRKLSTLSDQSAMELLRHFRLQMAFNILTANPEMNVKEICFKVGFKDPSHFSRLFSKTFQIAPSDFKKQHLSDNKTDQP